MFIKKEKIYIQFASRCYFLVGWSFASKNVDYHPDFLFFQEANDIAIESGLTSLDSSIPFFNINFKLSCKDGSFPTRIHASCNEMIFDFLSQLGVDIHI